MHLVHRPASLTWGALAVIGSAVTLWSVATAMFALGIYAPTDADFFWAALFLEVAACVPTGALVVRASRRKVLVEVLTDSERARKGAYEAVAKAVVDEVERRQKGSPSPTLRSV